MRSRISFVVLNANRLQRRPQPNPQTVQNSVQRLWHNRMNASVCHGQEQPQRVLNREANILQENAVSALVHV